MLAGIEGKEKRNYVILWILTGAIILLGVGGLMTFSYFYNNRCYTNYQVVTEVERSDSNNGSYQYFQKNLLKHSGSGISLISSLGKTLWNGGFEMKQPQVDVCGGQVLAVDVGGTAFYLYNGRDEGERMETTYPIVRGKVSGQGVCAVLEQDVDSNSLKLYNPYSNTTKLLAEIPTNVAEDGYPLDFDISPDGTTVVVAYMTVKGTESEYRVNFYNFSDVGQDKNILVGGREYGAEMVSQIRFVDNDHVAIYRENGYDIYTHMKQPEPVVQKTFDRAILSIADSETYIGVVTAGVGQGDKKLQLFTMKGELILEQSIPYEYAEFRIYGDELYFYGPYHIDIVRLNGTEKFSADFDSDITGVFPGGRSIEYLVVDHLSIKRIRMKAR